MVKRSLRAIFLTFMVLCLLAPAVRAEDEIDDPLEGFNRAVFTFNDTLDVYFFEPVARGYKKVVPSEVRTGVTNFFSNLRYPQYLVSDLVALEFGKAARHTGRFFINTIFGLGGLFDVAACTGLEHEPSDFALALAKDGVPPGPYLVLPILGPSTVRDGIGKLIDIFVLYPPSSVAYTAFQDDLPDGLLLGMSALDFVNYRADLIPAIESAKESSTDYYLFMQSSYLQYRKGLLLGKDADAALLEDDGDFGDDDLGEEGKD